LRFEECGYRLVRKILRSLISESVWGTGLTDGRVLVTLSYVTFLLKCVISGLRREVAENCAVMDHYAANSGNFSPTFRDNLSVPKEHSSHFITVML
jgi:hypothetical protein